MYAHWMYKMKNALMKTALCYHLEKYTNLNSSTVEWNWINNGASLLNLQVLIRKCFSNITYIIIRNFSIANYNCNDEKYKNDFLDIARQCKKLETLEVEIGGRIPSPRGLKFVNDLTSNCKKLTYIVYMLNNRPQYINDLQAYGNKSKKFFYTFKAIDRLAFKYSNNVEPLIFTREKMYD